MDLLISQVSGTPPHVATKGFFDPFEFVERVKVKSHAVVIDDPPVFQLVRGEHGIVTFIEQFCSVNGFPISHVSLALFFDDLLRNFEADISFDAPTSVSVAIAGVFGIALPYGG